MTKNVSIRAPQRNRLPAEISRFYSRLPAPVRDVLGEDDADRLGRLMDDLEAQYAPFSAIQAMSFTFTRGEERAALIEGERDLADKKLKRHQAVGRLHKKARRAIEYTYHWAAQIGAVGVAPYRIVSADTLNLYKLKKRDTRKWASKQAAVPMGNPGGKGRNLGEIIERSRAGRRAERWAMAFYLEHLAARPDWDWQAFFITLTLDGPWHSCPKNGNRTWNSQDVRAASDELNRREKAARDDFKNKTGHYPRCLGLGYRENHDDTTPHKHNFLFIHPDDREPYFQCLRRQFQGAALDVTPHDPTKGKFATYCIAYMKSGDEDDGDEENKKSGTLYAAAFGRWGMRRTETYGFRPGLLTQWREIGKRSVRPPGLFGQVWDLLKSGDHGDLIRAFDLMDAIPQFDPQRSQEYAALGRRMQAIQDEITDHETERGRLSRKRTDADRRAAINARIDALRAEWKTLKEARSSIPKNERQLRRLPSGWENERVVFNSILDRPDNDPRSPDPSELERSRLDAIKAPDGTRIEIERNCLILPDKSKLDGVFHAEVGNGPRDSKCIPSRPPVREASPIWAAHRPAWMVEEAARRRAQDRHAVRRAVHEIRRRARKADAERPEPLPTPSREESAARIAARKRALRRAAASYAQRLRDTGIPLTLDLLSDAADAAGLLIDGASITDAADKKAFSVPVASLGRISRSLSAEWRLRHAPTTPTTSGPTAWAGTTVATLTKPQERRQEQAGPGLSAQEMAQRIAEAEAQLARRRRPSTPTAKAAA